MTYSMICYFLACGIFLARGKNSCTWLRLRDTVEWAWLMLNFLNFSCLSLRVSIVQNLQSYAFSSLYGQLYLQESARLNFTHTQREIVSSLSIFCTRFKNLGTPFATTFLTYKALKDGRGIDRASYAQLYSGAKKIRKN